MIIHKQCPYCNKRIEVISEQDLGSCIIFTFKCNHSVVENKLQVIEEEKIDSLRSLSGHKLFPFQKLGVRFAFQSNVQCLIADEMGLGKTIEALACISLDREQLLPCIVLCKAIAQTNWLREIMNWVPAVAQIVNGSKATCHEKFKIHIVSLDLLSRLSENKSFLTIAARAKLIIIDESHLIKSNVTKRTVAVKQLVFNKFGNNGKKEESELSLVADSEATLPDKKVIALSGTPIKNNATEYFTILNILQPNKFYNLSNFCWNYVEQYYDARGNAWKYGGLKNPADFKRITAKFIIRRTMDEVLPELPKVWKQFRYVDLAEDIQKIYDQEWKEFTEFYEESEGKRGLEFYSNIMAKMARLRHLTGLAKIDFCLDNLIEFLGSTERKITVFVHHKDVGETLKMRLDDICQELQLAAPYYLKSEILNRQEYLDEFAASQSRILIASTLASGESVNMHEFCADVIAQERQWNPANEEQAFSGRFRRIGQTAEKINVNYLIAVGTIDEYFAELVERKRQIFDEAMSGEKSDTPWDESSLIKELAEVLATKGREKWKI